MNIVYIEWGQTQGTIRWNKTCVDEIHKISVFSPDFLTYLVLISVYSHSLK